MEAPKGDIIHFDVQDREGNWHSVDVPDDVGLNVMEACKAFDLDIQGTCGGMGICSSCHVYVWSDHDLPPVSEQEEETLDKAFHVNSNSRLCCQIHVDHRIDGLRIQLAPA